MFVHKYLVSYDLRAPGQDYRGLIRRLAELGAVRILKSQWLLVNGATAAAVRDDLRKYLDAGDGIIVFESPSHWASYGLDNGERFGQMIGA